MSSSLGWKCTRCTYEHQYPGTRCKMCDALRVTKQDMQNFVQGKPIPVQHTVNSALITTTTTTDAAPKIKEKPQKKVVPVIKASAPVRAPATKKSAPTKKTASSTTKKSVPPQALPKGNRILPYSPGPVPLDPSTASTWIYPTSPLYPKRQYQYEISTTAMSHNTLVSLPTGLGKTLIAATLAYNYYRWFPTGRIVFMAPTLPLVQQQVHACFQITGIPEADTGILTGKLHREQRRLIWQKCRLLFGTPQTIHHDITEDPVMARRIVCVIFDEAHKAVGEYAYVKVMEQLTRAKAQFRVLGLSATPGTSIVSIQKVVEALRMNRIEARCEADVKEYTHDRVHEVVVVPNETAQHTALRFVNALLEPLFLTLRNAGVLRTATVTTTAYSIQQAKEAYGGGPLSVVLLTTQKLVQLRADVQRHGLGLVRRKLVQFRQESYMASIVKKPEFGTLWDTVCQATTSSDDALRNNPKLSKLTDIVLEHFARHDETTRVIVFSQFRDSVGEIASSLQVHRPHVRARHFVGQSDGTLKGMKQAEQQSVLAEFCQGIHNVLVCTCIGEEGLDIGQVDLICNFDCLSSPIRMIQRVGRTGRKRNGRVVTLVSEGAEQQTFHQSLNKERTLVHSLRNRKFIVTPTVPMVPLVPLCIEQELAGQSEFHFSQVQGAKKQRPTGRKSGQWKLTAAQELLLERSLGRTTTQAAAVPLETLLRQRLLPARTRSQQKQQHSGGGAVNRLLRRFEGEFGKPAVVIPRKTKTPTLFPMEQQPDDTLGAVCTAKDDANRVEFGRANGPAKAPNNKRRLQAVEPGPLVPNNSPAPLGSVDRPSVPHMIVNPYSRKTQPPKVPREQLPPQTHPNVPQQAEPLPPPLPPTVNPSKVPQPREQVPPPQTHPNVPPPPQEAEPLPRSLPLTVNPGTTDNCVQEGPEVFCEFKLPSQDDSSVESAECEAQQQNNSALDDTQAIFRLPDDDDDSSVDTEIETHQQQSQHPALATAEAVFRLPTQDDSSEDEGDESNAEGLGTLHGNKKETTTPSNAEKTPGSLHHSSVPLKPTVVIRNPYQVKPKYFVGTAERNAGVETEANRMSDARSKRGAEESPVVKSKRQRTFILADTPDSAVKGCAGEGVIQEIESDRATWHGPAESSVAKESMGLAIADTPESVFGVAFSVGTKADQRNLSDRTSVPDLTQPTVVKAKRHKRLVIADTPESPDEPNSSVRQLQNPPIAHSTPGLTNTPTAEPVPDDADSIVCAICTSNALSDEDPLILCDGCDMAVHSTCYSASIDLINDDEKEWLCDVCNFQRTAKEATILFCSACSRKDGILKRSPLNGYWVHVRCPAPIGKRLANRGLRKLSKARAPLIDLSQNDDCDDDNATEFKKRRKLASERFLDVEALAESGESEEDEDDIEAVEDEEKNSSFINDSSQLGFSQDDLDQAELALDDNAPHRSLDLKREKMREFATPMLNRRQNRSSFSGNSPDSCSGLGNLHFVRSVLEHHRQGGDAEDIEKFYNQLEDQN